MAKKIQIETQQCYSYIEITNLTKYIIKSSIKALIR